MSMILIIDMCMFFKREKNIEDNRMKSIIACLLYTFVCIEREREEKNFCLIAGLTIVIEIT